MGRIPEGPRGYTAAARDSAVSSTAAAAAPTTPAMFTPPVPVASSSPCAIRANAARVNATRTPNTATGRLLPTRNVRLAPARSNTVGDAQGNAGGIPVRPPYHGHVASSTTGVLDREALHRAVCISVRDAVGLELRSVDFQAALGRTCAAPADEAAVKRALRNSLSVNCKDAVNAAQCRGVLIMEEALLPQLKAATQVRIVCVCFFSETVVVVLW